MITDLLVGMDLLEGTLPTVNHIYANSGDRLPWSWLQMLKFC